MQHPERLTGWRFAVFNLSLGLGHLIVLLNAGAYIAMLPRVAGGLGIPPSLGTWTQTDYMIGLALAFPLASWLSSRIGDYRLFSIAFVVFALASVLIAVSRDLHAFLCARILLGLAGGITLPLGQSLILKEYPEEKKSLGLAVWSVFTLSPFTLGTSIGGWIADNPGWRWLFYLNVPASLCVAASVAALLYGRDTNHSPRRLDGVGYLLLVLVLGGTQTFLNQGNDWDWMASPYLVWVGATVLVALAYLIVWEWDTPQPLIDLRLFTQRNFTIGFIGLFGGFLIFQGMLSLLVVQLQLLMGYPSFLAGLVFLPMAVFAKPLAAVMHEAVKRTDARALASLNLLAFAFIYLYLGTFDHADDFEQILWPKLVEGFCLGSFFVPLTAIMLDGLPAERHVRAIEFANLMRITAGSFGITLQGVMLHRRTPFHQSRVVEHLTAFDRITNETVQRFAARGFTEEAAIATLAKLTTRHAALLAINDAFWIAGWAFLVLSLLVWAASPAVVRRQKPIHELRRESLEELIEEP